MKPINETVRNLRVMMREIGKYTPVASYPVENIIYKPLCEYKVGSDLPKTDDFVPFTKDMRWGEVRDSHAWFAFTVHTPKEMVGKELKLSIDTGIGNCWDAVNPQLIAYVDGHIRQGMDANHTYIMLDGKDSYDVMIYAYSGMEHERKGLRFDVNIVEENLDVKKYYYDLAVPFDIIEFLDENTYTYQNILSILEKSTSLVNMLKLPSPEFYESVKVADAYLQKEFYQKFCKDQDIKTICIGHTHIDIAWLWTIDQTREKAQRSFATVIELMKRYPEYKFMSSQAVLYKMVKEECPELYEEIKAMIKAGRWEVEGAMWVEADCNLSSGESLVRQVQYGKNFFRDEFGVESHVLWLPDVFGYSAALPQILRKSDVDWFVTSKIGWNDTNTVPYDTFKWKGLDGTEINTYFITAQQEKKGRVPERTSTYIPHTDFSYVDGAWNRYQQKNLHNEALLTFGWGDGGGGPTAHMLENLRRANAGVPQIAQAKIGFAGEFLDNLEKSMKKKPELVPSWQGELYLEFHRGTYTSIAKNKKNNRDCEFLLLDTEALCVMLDKIRGAKFPKEELHNMWEVVLVNQFHDIIPGSSIPEVYERSDKDYAEVKQNANKIRETVYDYIASNVEDSGYVIFNPHSFTGSGVVDIDGQCVSVSNIPPKGYKVISELDTKNTIEVKGNTVFTKYFSVKFDKNCNITSIYDKKNHREVIKRGALANRFIAFVDYPDAYSAWELQRSSNDKEYDLGNAYDVKTVVNGAKTGISFKKKHMSSEISQTIWFYESMPRIDFETKVDWHEKSQILKVSFPVDINTDKATYEVQFGSIERPTHYNTSWEQAKFEVCGHKYADLSEGNYGVSLLNNCKYGHDIHNSDMRLTLIKCAPNPDNNPNSINDQGLHEFTYSIYPHKNAINAADTVKYAYDLNMPMTARKCQGGGKLANEYSLVSISCDNVICETIKEAEYSSDTVVRLYEAKNSRSRVTLKLGFDVKEAYLADLNEKPIKNLAVKNNSVSFDIKPFEIVTLLLK